MHLLACTLAGTPVMYVDVSEVSAEASLVDPGEATFTVRAYKDAADYLAPWGGMLVLLDNFGTVLWCGVPVKRRGAVSSGTWEITAREWCHWLERVSALKYDASSAPYDEYGDYEGAYVGTIINDLFTRIPQSESGFVQVPLLPPVAGTGSVVTIGDAADLSVSRPSVWEFLSTARDYGVDIWAQTAWETNKYVPRIIVGNPKIGDTNPVPLWLGDNVSSVYLEEDGDLMTTRWRVKGYSEGAEKFVTTGSGHVLLDTVKDYGDRFSEADEELVLGSRAEKLVAGSNGPVRYFSDIEASPELALYPGDAVTVSTPPLDDPLLSGEYEVTGRIESIRWETNKTTITMADPQDEDAPVFAKTRFTRQLRNMGGRVRQIGARA